MGFSLAIWNRQRSVRFNVRRIRRIAELASPHCLASVCSPSAPLPVLERIEVTILSDRRMGRVHADFLGDPSPTDVITFDHGEILLGAETIAGNARRYGHRPDEEAALCLIHGLLHLAGWKDKSAAQARRMARLQEQIFKKASVMV